ncbi:MAG: NlpC/P60 family protein [Acidimicrobiales bacterium]
MKKVLLLGSLAAVMAIAVPVIGAAASLLALLPGAGRAPTGGTGVAGDVALPAQMEGLYQVAAATCPGLPWTVLAAIGTTESDNGASTSSGVHSGANAAGAEGPMQFEPATFAAYDTPVPPGGADPPSPYDPTDAVYAAARDLCANGARGGTDVPAAIFAYNHDPGYVERVLSLAGTFGEAGGAPPAGPAAAAAVEWALSQIGTPYRWGAEEPGIGFDCSGLAQAAYGAAGVALPRVAQAQFDAGPILPAGTPLDPGDLVFFGSGPSNVTHVGMVVHDGEMVDAPRAGAAVRVESYDWPDYVGATRPAGAMAGPGG